MTTCIVLMMLLLLGSVEGGETRLQGAGRWPVVENRRWLLHEKKAESANQSINK